MMERRIWARILAFVLALECMVCMAACGGAGQEAKKAQVREKLLLAYQYLENMEFDTALDAFAQVIEIDEKIPDAYIGMARAYSAKGQHAQARETAARGREASENETLATLENMYTRIEEREDALKDLAALLKEGEEKVPGQLQETESGLFSELLDRIWEKLDDGSTWDIFSGTGYALVYPVDPENGQYLIIYPSGYFYLGEVEYVPYSEILAREEGLEEGSEETVSRDPVIIPARNGYGLFAYVDEQGEIAGFYLGGWKDGLPEDSEALFAWQEISGGARFVYFGKVEAGKFALASALYGSTDVFLDAALGIREEDFDPASELNLQGVYPFEHGAYDLLFDGRHTGGIYSSDFLNRDLFERIGQGDASRILKERAQAKSPVPIDGDLFFLAHGWTVMDFDMAHGIYITAMEGKGFDTPYFAVNAKGEILFSAYEEQIWLTSSGFSGLLITEAGTETPFEGDIYAAWGGTGEDADVWQLDFDWEGRETGRKYMGQVEDAYSFVHYGGFNAASIWGGDASASGSRIRAERTGDGFRITDLDGKDCGTIHVDDPEDFTYAINGNMIQIRKSDYTMNYLFQVVPD